MFVLIVDATRGAGLRIAKPRPGGAVAVRVGERPVTVADEIGAEITRLGRPHWYRRGDDGQVVRKVLVHLTADKLVIAADGEDHAEVTHDAGASVLLDVAGVEQQAETGIAVTASVPRQIRVQVSASDPLHYTDDTAETADGGPLLLIAEVPDA